MVDSIISQPKVSLSSWNTPVSDPSKTNGITTGKNLSSFFTYQPGVVGVKSLIHFEDTLTGYDDYADPELYPKDETGRSWYQSGGDTNYVTTANAKFGTSAMLSNTPFWMHAAGSGDFDLSVRIVAGKISQ
jgi:hypothetical protein